MANDTCSLFCLIEGDTNPFQVTVSAGQSIYFLKEVILEQAFRDVDAVDLVLWKLNEPVSGRPAKTLAERTSGLGELSQFATELEDPTDRVFDVFPEQPSRGFLHIIVQKPLDQHASKRARLDNSRSPHTPSYNRTYVGQTSPTPEAPSRLSKADTQASITSAFEPFKQYIEYLATGKLDGYLDSVDRKDKFTVPGLSMSTDPHLLLHDLGKYTDQERVGRLFRSGTTQVFETSGAGKTRLLLEGLCDHWGFYISCSTKYKGPVSGSRDFETAVLQSMSSWNQNISSEAVRKGAAKLVFAMVLYARAFTLEQFVRCLPVGTDVRVARRRWVLLQAMPPRVPEVRTYGTDYDIFDVLCQSLHNADTDTMLSFIQGTLFRLSSQREDLFPLVEGFRAHYFVIIDEAQEAADHLSAKYFRSNTRVDLRPILREFYLFLHSSSWARGIILSGTGLSTHIAEYSSRSSAMKETGRPIGIKFFTDTGRFLRNESSQRDYVLRYLSLSEDNISDVRLLERILYWFPGRHRFTASFIELLLTLENAPRHRVLSALVEQTTGFSLTDAMDLEEEEDPIPPDMMKRIEHYAPVGSADRIVEDPTKQGLIQCLISIVIRWTICGQATSIPIENQMHDIIGFGIGQLTKITPDNTFNANINYPVYIGGPFNAHTNYPVYIDEPLIILYLRCLFENWLWTSRKARLTNLLSSVIEPGYILNSEELVLMVLMEKFGDRFTALNDVFEFPQASTLGFRRVRLVSLRRDTDGMMRCCPVSWSKGSSDRIGFKAVTPADVLEFLKDPRGITALFPDSNCGPDLISIFQDEETKELISVSCQTKASQDLKIETWLKALDSVPPEYFYTVMKEDEKRGGYAPASYPRLSEQVRMYFEEILGDKVYTPVIDVYRQKLRGATTAQQEPSLPERKTPSFLRIVSSPDDDQAKLLVAELRPTAILKWAVVKDHTGPAADTITTKQKSVYY